MNLVSIFCKATYNATLDTIQHDGIEHAGYIAFLSILSVFPFLVFLFAAVGFLGNTDIGMQFFSIIINNNIVPSEAMNALKPRILEIISGPPQSLLTLSIIGAIWTSSSMVESLRTTLNRAYRVSTPPAYIFRRLMSVLQFLIITAIIIAVSFIFIIAPNIWEALEKIINAEVFISIEKLFQITTGTISQYLSTWHVFRYITTITIIFMMVMASYYVLPNIKQKWLEIVPGSIFVIILWMFIGSLFAKYLSNFDQVHIIYGSLAGMIASLLFFYINAMIFIFGAEFNYHISQLMGIKVEAKE